MSFLARFTHTGPSDWIIQRITSVIMAAYLFFLVGYLLANPSLTYGQWAGLNSLLVMRLFSLVTISAVAYHAWIGMWCVLTDYITVRLIGPKADRTGIHHPILYGVDNQNSLGTLIEWVV
jgi:succinate dehydrogenase / fumarate reductase membrane anchor subunit